MAFASNPGALFVGGLSPDDKRFVASVLAEARLAGYDRVVEPCAGQLAMSCLAADAGFRRIEASDVTVFSGVLGRYASGRGIDDMGIRYADGGSPSSADEVMYEIKRRELESSAGSLYGYGLLRDYESREDEVRASMRESMDVVRRKVGDGFSYVDEDVFSHVARVMGDPHTVVLAMFPTYKGGYERFYRAIDEAVEWDGPRYDTFDPATDYARFLDLVADAPALVLFYEEVPDGEPVGVPVYGRHGGREGINTYLVSNRPEEVEGLLGGASCSRRDAYGMAPSRFPLMPEDHVLTRHSRIDVVRLTPANVRYYRRLLTHNFVPSQASEGFGLVVDGYLAGVFGYMTMTATLGSDTDSAFIGFGMTTRTGYRLNRLLYVVACQRSVLSMCYTDLQMATIRDVRTVMLTKYPESKEMRGIMRLVAKEPDDRMGFKLTYAKPVEDRDLRQVLLEFLQKEERWQRQRAKAASRS